MLEVKQLGELKGFGAAQWIEVGGYITNVKELSDIFGISFMTLRNRLASNWKLVPACCVPNAMGLSVKETNQVMVTDKYDDEFLTALSRHMGRPSLQMFPKV
jgi:hypothetical protein